MPLQREPCFSDHLYGEHASQFVRLWRPPSTTPVGIVYIVHGGFWKEKYGLNTPAGTACETIAPDLVRRGFAAVEIEYRRGDTFPFPVPSEDVAAAVSFVDSRLKRHYNLLDADSATMLGFSAGGQLVLLAVLEIETALRPSAVIAVAPVANLALAAELRLSDDGDAVVRYMGGSEEEIPSKYARACPTCRACELAQMRGRIAIVAGGKDTDVPLQVVNSLRDALKGSAGQTRARVLDLPDAAHYDMMNATNPAWAGIAALLLK
jgi:acetyl esterase/lipase